MRWIRTLVVTLLVLLVVAALLGVPALYALGRPQGRAVSIEKIHAEQGIPVEAVHPARREFRDYFYCDGRVVADVRAMLRAKVDEVVEAVHARVGEPVQKGQVLVEFRRTDLEASVQAARTAYEEAENNYERYAKLREDGVISQDLLEQYRTRRDNLAAALETARSRLQFAEVASPIDGVVEERWVEPGEYKGVGKELMSIVDLSTVEVAALVPEEQMLHVSVGMEGEFLLEAEEEWLKGAVGRIAPSTTDPNRFFDVYLKVSNRPVGGGWLMRPGMYAEARFLRGKPVSALAVPDNAVVLEDDSQIIYVVERSVEQVKVEAPANRAEEQEQDGGLLARLARGAGRIRGFARRLGPNSAPAAPQEATQETFEEVELQRARRREATVGLTEEGFVQLRGDSFSADELVIVNPREAIADGVRVEVVEGEGLR
jgi:RND family efflux transporter MFP subunit